MRTQAGDHDGLEIARTRPRASAPSAYGSTLMCIDNDAAECFKTLPCVRRRRRQPTGFAYTDERGVFVCVYNTIASLCICAILWWWYCVHLTLWILPVGACRLLFLMRFRALDVGTRAFSDKKKKSAITSQSIHQTKRHTGPRSYALRIEISSAID